MRSRDVRQVPASSEFFPPFQSRRKLFLRVSLVCGLLFVPFAQAKSPPYTEYHEGLQSIGNFLILVCIIGRAWCGLYISGKKSKELVQTGPYSITRNPLYLFSLIGVLGIGLQTVSLTITATILLITTIVFLSVIREEEQILAERFGREFEAYKARTPRLGVRLSAWRDEKVVSFEPRLLYRTVGDTLIFAGAIPLFDAIDQLQISNVLPVLIRLP